MSALHRVPGGVRALWSSAEPARPTLAWLGQAGFALRAPGLRLLIDPYLSDHLEKKYRGSARPHERLMPAPVTPAELTDTDFVLCTHRHSDHLDPEAIPQLAAASPACRFILPAAEETAALALGLPAARLVLVNAGDRIDLAPGFALEAIAAAHENFEADTLGRHRFLGYILRLGARTLYHSGDTVPYLGLVETLAKRSIDLALLPVNGRGKGVAGNFTFAEAAETCRLARIPDLIPHHFGMFAFNTVELPALVAQSAATSAPRVHLPDLQSCFEF